MVCSCRDLFGPTKTCKHRSQTSPCSHELISSDNWWASSKRLLLRYLRQAAVCRRQRLRRRIDAPSCTGAYLGVALVAVAAAQGACTARPALYGVVLIELACQHIQVACLHAAWRLRLAICHTLHPFEQRFCMHGHAAVIISVHHRSSHELQEDIAPALCLHDAQSSRRLCCWQLLQFLNSPMAGKLIEFWTQEVNA